MSETPKANEEEEEGEERLGKEQLETFRVLGGGLHPSLRGPASR